MGKAFVSGGAVMTAPVVPVVGTPLSEIAVGSIVKLNESGSPVDFYVAKHDYESGLNGSGKTLLVRVSCHSMVAFNLESANDKSKYENSNLSRWLTGTYYNTLDANVRSLLSTTSFYATNGNGTKVTLSSKVFALSLVELGLTDVFVTGAGSTLPIASTLRSSSHPQWTRSGQDSGANHYDYACAVTSGARKFYKAVTDDEVYARPCFTLPATALVADDGSIII